MRIPKLFARKRSIVNEIVLNHIIIFNTSQTAQNCKIGNMGVKESTGHYLLKETTGQEELLTEGDNGLRVIYF